MNGRKLQTDMNGRCEEERLMLAFIITVLGTATPCKQNSSVNDH